MNIEYRGKRGTSIGVAAALSLLLVFLSDGLIPCSTEASYAPGEFFSCMHNENEYFITIEAAEGVKERESAAAENFDVENCSVSMRNETGMFSFTHPDSETIDRCKIDISVCDKNDSPVCAIARHRGTAQIQGNSIAQGTPAPAAGPVLTDGAIEDGAAVMMGASGNDGCSGSVTTDKGDYSFATFGGEPAATTVMRVEICGTSDPETCEVEEVTVRTRIVNRPPAIVTVPPGKAVEDLFYSYEAKAEDREGPGAFWSVQADDTCGGSVDAATGLYIFTPAGPIPAAGCTMSIEVCDGGEPNFCDTQTVPVSIQAGNDSPVITSSAPGAAIEDRLYRYEATATDDDGPDAVWSVLEDDTCGGAVDAATGEYVFTPRGPVPAGGCSISIRVCDGDAAETCDTQKTKVSIKAVNDAPEIVTTAPVVAVEGRAYRYDADAVDADGPRATWRVRGDDTCRGSIDAATGEYGFTPGYYTAGDSCVLSIGVCDGGAPGFCDKEKIVVAITDIRVDPLAVDDRASTTSRSEVVVPVLDNDLHGGGGELYLTSVFTGDTAGHARANVDGTVTYRPSGQFDHLRSGESAADSFEYTISDGEGGFATALVAVTVSANENVAGDWNGDGHPDILWRNYRTGKNYLFYMRGNEKSGVAALPSLPDTDWVAGAVSDFNADGRPDILWRNYATGANRIWHMNGTEQAGEVSLPTVPTDWLVAGTGDFNGDGGVDILWRNDTSGRNYVSFMNGAAPKGGALLPKMKDRDWEVAGLADLNADGHADVLWRHALSGRNLVWLMDGTKVASRTALKRLGNTDWEVAGLADFNGDSHPDIHWRHAGTGENLLWHLNGTAVAGVDRLPSVADTDWHPEY